MRPIDADALKEEHGMADDCPLCKQKVRSCQYDTIYTKMDFCGWIDDAPTIEPERRTGKWLETNVFQRWECSVCGERTMDAVMGKPRANFCPNCGADMGEEGGQE